MTFGKRKCKDCRNAEKKLSHKGLCEDCAVARTKIAGLQIKAKKGKYFENYQKGILNFLNIETNTKNNGNFKKD